MGPKRAPAAAGEVPLDAASVAAKPDSASATGDESGVAVQHLLAAVTAAAQAAVPEASQAAKQNPSWFEQTFPENLFDREGGSAEAEVQRRAAALEEAVRARRAAGGGVQRFLERAVLQPWAFGVRRQATYESLVNLFEECEAAGLLTASARSRLEDHIT